MDWFQFEKVVGHVYEKRGYTVTRRGDANPDDGIDLMVERNGQRTGIQCKQWKTAGVKAIREFLGALSDAGMQKGVFITLRGGTEAAKQLAGTHDVEILDVAGLAGMLDAIDVGDDPQVQELLRDTRKICPKCERELVVRVAGRGNKRGGKFWGCSGYSRGCRFRMPID
jgi:restriction system protein